MATASFVWAQAISKGGAERARRVAHEDRIGIGAAGRGRVHGNGSVRACVRNAGPCCDGGNEDVRLPEVLRPASGPVGRRRGGRADCPSVALAGVVLGGVVLEGGRGRVRRRLGLQGATHRGEREDRTCDPGVAKLGVSGEFGTQCAAVSRLRARYAAPGPTRSGSGVPDVRLRRRHLRLTSQRSFSAFSNAASPASWPTDVP